MTPKLAICFFSCVLLLMNGKDIDAREMKVKVQDQEEVDLYEALPGSSDEAYITGYRTTSKPTQYNHITSYLVPKHNHPSHHGNLNQPYITSYKTSATHEANQPNYLAGYRTSNYDSNTPYIAGYTRNGAYDTNQPYIPVYGSNQHDYNSKNAPKDSSQNDEPYITQYGVPGPKKDPKRLSHDDEPYITQYGSMGPKKDLQKSSHDDKPYITQYGGIGPKKYPKESSHDNEPYITQYVGSYPKNYPKESSQDDEPYITQYGGTDLKKDPKVSSSHDNKPYITQYGDIGPKKHPKESSHDDEPYTTQNCGTTPKKHPKKSHIEAFKSGFFVLDDLYVGNVMTLQFSIQEVSPFLPRKEAESIPFSMAQLPSIVQLFSIPEDTHQTNAMRDTLQQCEAEPIRGETKTCATSLESMLEFVATIIGSEAKYNILTTSYPTSSSVPLQNYTVLEVSKDINAPKWVACHPLPYPYAVYYCHFIATGTKVFKVLLGSENGDDKIEALGVCHLDTSDWSQDHILFRQLGFKPGQAPVCHFFPVKHLMWVPQPSEATM